MSLACPDRLVIRLHERRTEVQLEDALAVVHEDRPEFTRPLAEVKAVAAELAGSGFHITAYRCTKNKTPKIRVQLRGERVDGRPVWKKTGSFKTEEEAVRLITAESERFDAQTLVVVPLPPTAEAVATKSRSKK